MDFSNHHEPIESGTDRNWIKYLLIGVAVVCFIGLAVLIYNFFIMTPQTRLLSSYHNLLKKVDSDYGKIQKKLGFEQDFSKEAHRIFTLENVEKGRFGQVLEGVESISLHLIQSDRHKQYQFLLTAKKVDGVYDLFGLEIGEEKISMMYPEMNNKVYTLSAKNFGKDFNEISKNLKLYYSQFSQVDLSYSKIRENLGEKYDRKRVLERYLNFFEALFQDVNIKQIGDTYSCLISPENLEEAVENALNQAIKDFEDFDIYNSKGLLEVLKFNLVNQIKNFAMTLETKITDATAKEFEIKMLYRNDGMGRIKFSSNTQKNENIFKDMGIEIYNVDEEGHIHIQNKLEEKEGELINTISAKSDIFDNLQSNLIFTFKNPDTLNNFAFRMESFRDGEYRSSVELRGDYKTQRDSYSFLIPFIFLDPADMEKIDVPLGIRYEVKKDTSKRWNFAKDRVEVKMVDMKKENFEELLEEMKEFDEKMLKINKI